jgi:hypothetical protein
MLEKSGRSTPDRSRTGPESKLGPGLRLGKSGPELKLGIALRISALDEELKLGGTSELAPLGTDGPLSALGFTALTGRCRKETDISTGVTLNNSASDFGLSCSSTLS